MPCSKRSQRQACMLHRTPGGNVPKSLRHSSADMARLNTVIWRVAAAAEVLTESAERRATAVYQRAKSDILPFLIG